VPIAVSFRVVMAVFQGIIMFIITLAVGRLKLF
jgi:hypothetical protein